MVSFAPQRTQSFTEKGKGAPPQLQSCFRTSPNSKLKNLKTQTHREVSPKPVGYLEK